MFYLPLAVIFSLITFYAWMITFKKLGLNKWKALIPIYNFIILFNRIGVPIWYLFLYLIPIVSFFAHWVFCRELSKSFGLGNGFAVGLLFLNPIFIMIIAFSDDKFAVNR